MLRPICGFRIENKCNPIIQLQSGKKLKANRFLTPDYDMRHIHAITTVRLWWMMTRRSRHQQTVWAIKEVVVSIVWIAYRASSIRARSISVCHNSEKIKTLACASRLAMSDKLRSSVGGGRIDRGIR